MLLLYVFLGVIGLFILGLIISVLTPDESAGQPGRKRPNRHMEDTWHHYSEAKQQDPLRASHQRFMDATNKRLRDAATQHTREVARRNREESDKRLKESMKRANTLSAKTTQQSIAQSTRLSRERAKNPGKNKF